MAKFKDADGREWILRITVGGFEQLRDRLDIDLYQLVDGRMGGLSALLRDPVRLASACWVLCAEQAEAANCDRPAFFDAIWGEALGAAAEAFMEAMVDFFPDARTREMLRLVLAKGREAAEEMMTLAVADVRQAAAKVDPRAVAAAAISAWKPPSGDSPASSASTPPTAPAASSSG